jgi:hypothetical protein
LIAGTRQCAQPFLASASQRLSSFVVVEKDEGYSRAFAPHSIKEKDKQKISLLTYNIKALVVVD